MSSEYPPGGPGSDPERNAQQGGPQPGHEGGSYGQSYGAPPPGYQPGAAQPKVSPLAIVSLVLAVIGFCCGQLFVVDIAAIVTGFVARKQIVASRGMLTGLPVAIIGIVIGVLGILAGIAYWVAIATGALDPSMLRI